jgi:hypothetical protein
LYEAFANRITDHGHDNRDGTGGTHSGSDCSVSVGDDHIWLERSQLCSEFREA